MDDTREIDGAYYQINDPVSALEAHAANSSARRFFDGEKELMKAVLEDAVKSIGASPDTAKRREVRNDALAWIRSDDESYVLSFVPVCLALGLSPTATRRRVLSGAVKRREYTKTDAYWKKREAANG